MKNILLSLVFLGVLQANELESLLDSLLHTYAQESDLSNNTKIENSGTTQLTLYTRQDLDRLKIQTLRDIFTTQRILTYRESRLGYVDFSSAEPLVVGKAGQVVKIFIDDNEITNSYYGTGLTILGNMELDFVDHIEIYEGAASYDHSTEASIYTVKIYTKTGKRDNGRKIGGLVDHRGAHKAYSYIAGSEDELEYFLYASNRDLKREKIKNALHRLSRDEVQQHLYAKVNYQNNNFTFQYLNQDRDAFLTNSIDATPIKDDIQQSLLHIAYDRTFLDDESLRLKASFNRHNFQEDFLDDNSFTTILGAPIYGEKRDIVENLWSFDLNKRYKIENNDFLVGILSRYSNLNYKKNQYLATPLLTSIDLPYMFDSQRYHSLYFQNSYRLNTNHTFTIGVKLDYEKTSNFESEFMVNRRISHTYTNGNFSFMNYYTYQPMLKNAFLFNHTQSSIKNEKIEMLGNETRYVWNNYEFMYLLYKINLEDMLLNSPLGIINSSEDMDMIGNSFRIVYNFDKENTILAEAWRFDVKLDVANIDNRTYGFYIRSLNKYQKLDITNELFIVDSTATDTEEDIGWQYNLGVTYHYSKDLEFFARGYNFFDSAIEYNYLNYQNGQGNITSTEQRFYVGFGYTF